MEGSSLRRDKEWNEQARYLDGCSKHRFSVTFSDFTLPTNCSPNFASDKIYETSIDFHGDCHNVEFSPVQLFSETKQDHSSVEQLLTSNNKFETSLELLHVSKAKDIMIGINAGGEYESTVCDGKVFERDNFFTGGDTISTDVQVGDGGSALYQSARFGDFSYEISQIEEGDYFIDLHLAEIVFTNGPPGMRIFDVYIQEEKVVFGIDIYAMVGSNKPLILPDLRVSINEGERLIIRWKRQYDLIVNEQEELKRALEDCKRENELKSQECYEAWSSLQEVQTELMRKSMHVGSLAFAVEGQVKEKSRWCQGLEDLIEKIKMMKLKHVKLSEEALEYKKCLVDMTSMMNNILSSTQLVNHINLESQCKDLKLKFIEEARERKELYNKMIEMTGNIRVFCRCRPINGEEKARGEAMALDFEYAKDGELIVKTSGAPKKSFKFDSVFGPETGTGKTFTMEGTEAARGVNYRILDELFRVVKERKGLFQYEITVSVLEVYNEQIHDLLLSDSQPGVAAMRLEVRQTSEGVHHVPGLIEAHVSNMNEVWQVLQTGSKARFVGSTNANEHSSRSHCIHCVMVRGENLMNWECTKSKLWLIDLAGSERIAKTDVQGERLKEAQSINKSLSALGDVISALATKCPHIPFRNSKLTHLLQDSLGGDSKTLMFVQISPSENDVAETLCSLNFASRVRGIELGHAKKQFDGGEFFKSKQMVEKAKQEIKYKEFQIKKMEEAICSLESKNKAKDLLNKNLQERVKELESQLLIERKLARQHVDSKIAENQHQKQHNLLDPNTSLNYDPSNMPLLEKNQNCFADHRRINNIPSSDTTNLHKLDPLEDKENTLELAEEEMIPRKPGRISVCNPSRRISMTPMNRRESLIPPPAGRTSAFPYIPPQFPLAQANIKDDSAEEINGCQGPRKVSKNINSILRRSLQKKLIIRSPLPQASRKVAGVGEKGRVSLGDRRWKERRVPVSDVAVTDKAAQQKKLQKKKERGWNLGTGTKNVFS
ncbi:Kinesin-4 [Apostasia shenzhenica]|uniref:Kinesin-4 n=1 Tax=Apostasia shenzhenica TaxID=1088818 RepID=A0A2I0AEI0_9ASPA|nr:Kinesin-4 [Apostasia shenzhenica]